MNTSDRFWSKVAEQGECWVWTANKSSQGYGRFKVDGKVKFAHRVSYEMMVTDIPTGLEIDHLCRNTSCVRPDHLDAVSAEVNRQRALDHPMNRVECSKGHPFSGRNLAITHSRAGSVRRVCRQCANARERASRARQAEQRRAAS